MKSGIYTITNIRNGKLYLGRSKNVYHRLKEHERNLKNDRHCNDYLQRAYNLEPQNFLFEVLELYPIHLIIDMEQYWLNLTQAWNRDLGYSLDQSAYNTPGKLSEETKEKIRRSAIGRKCDRGSVEKTRLKNLGQIRPTQSLKMKENWINVKDKMGFNNLTTEEQDLVRQKLSKATKLRYANIDNLPKSRQPVTIDGVNYPSLRSAARMLGIDKATVKSRYLKSK